MKYKNRGRSMYAKKDHITVQWLNQCTFLKIYHEIGSGNDVKQMESLRDTADWKEKKEKRGKRRTRRRNKRKERNIEQRLDLII